MCGLIKIGVKGGFFRREARKLDGVKEFFWRGFSGSYRFSVAWVGYDREQSWSIRGLVRYGSGLCGQVAVIDRL